MEINLQIKRDETQSDIATRWLRRDYTQVFEQTLQLTSAKTLLKHHLSSIQFVYINRVGNQTSIFLYRNLSPERWTFDDTFLAWGLGDLTSLTLAADEDTEVYVFLGGT